MPMPTLNSAPTLTSKNDTVVYTSGSNSGGVWEGVGVCAVSAGQGVISLFTCQSGQLCKQKKNSIFLKSGLSVCNAL